MKHHVLEAPDIAGRIVRGIDAMNVLAILLAVLSYAGVFAAGYAARSYVSAWRHRLD